MRLLLQVLAAMCVTGKLAEVCLLSSMRVRHGSCQQHMLLHGVLLLLVHQDPLQQYLHQLALMVLGYGTCHLWMSGRAAATAGATGGGTVAAWATADAAGVTTSSRLASLGVIQWNSSSNSLLGLTTSGEFFVNAFMMLLLLHHVYHACVGPREKQISSSSSSSRRCSVRRSRRVSAAGSANIAGSIAGTATAAGSAAAARDVHQGSSVTPGPSSEQVPASAEPAVDTAAATKVQQQQQQQQLAGCIWRIDEASSLLNAAFVWKLAVVKLSNAAFVALYSLQCLQHAQSAIAVRLGGFMFNPCHIGLVSLVAQHGPCNCVCLLANPTICAAVSN
jgi:hypothetical protein